jgi:hypothetical protein
VNDVRVVGAEWRLMEKPSKQLEQKIERIHRLLEVEGSTVTWNDHIPDPDNPDQMRQIDVTVRRDDFLTMIECRLRAKPQDVQWIEELIGRRISLKADAAIAVSASGFTKTAREKAAKYGIHLRDFATLTPEEIQNWGRKRTLRISFCEFAQVVLTLRMKEPRDGKRPI